jgi:thiamine kinase-like enzyme
MSYEDGWTPEGLNYGRWSDEQLRAAFKLLRRFHDTTAHTNIADSAEVACHNDFAPPNLVFRDGLPKVMIDWEWAAPGTRRRDLANAIWQWLNLGEDGPSATEQGRRMREVLRAYGDPGDSIVEDILDRQGEWIRLADAAITAGREYASRSPEHWTQIAAWVRRERAWLIRHRTVIEERLGQVG